MPPGFSWVDPPHLAALAYPRSPETLTWLREQGIDILISLTEETPYRNWINDAGLMSIHLPVSDMTAPSQEQLKQAVDAIEHAVKSQMGVAVHCAAGLGRTGTILAAYFVSRGDTAEDAIQKVRRQRPGSIETHAQVEAIYAYARQNS
jgi:atypical dual specificity phosphatase